MGTVLQNSRPNIGTVQNSNIVTVQNRNKLNV